MAFTHWGWAEKRSPRTRGDGPLPQQPIRQVGVSLIQLCNAVVLFQGNPPTTAAPLRTLEAVVPGQ